MNIKLITATLLLLILCSLITAAHALVGDADCNGELSITDALLTAQYYVGVIAVLPCPEAADTDCSNTVDIVDALLIARAYVGLEQLIFDLTF